jgi:hypothetical protein
MTKSHRLKNDWWLFLFSEIIFSSDKKRLGVSTYSSTLMIKKYTEFRQKLGCPSYYYMLPFIIVRNDIKNGSVVYGK